MDDCPTVETLSIFIEGKLSPENRESVVAHLGDCAECYSVVSESLTIREELNSRFRARIKKHLYRSVPAALAAAAVLLLVVRLLPPTQESTGVLEREPAARQAQIVQDPLLKTDSAVSTRSFAGTLADRRAGNTNTASLARIAGNQHKPAPAYGFSSAVSLEKAAFGVGRYLTDLELALKAKDQKNVEVFAKRLIELLKPMESSYGLIPSIVESGNSGKEAVRYKGFSKAVEALFKNKREGLFLKFGAWVEAASLAAEAGDAAFFQPAVVSGFAIDLKKNGVPVGTLKDLAQLEEIISSGEIHRDQFTNMVHLLADIKDMY